MTAVVVVARWVTHGRIFLEKFTAGPATISLAGPPATYFDQYIDEIVYYFEKTRRNIVVFEDLDRFGNVQIFETLRALNTLLNAADQIRHRPRVKQRPGQASADVVFIYALRDSVFERLGSSPETETGDASEEELRRANRTKFFELVIPVVPFITHRNARDLMTDQMSKTGVGFDLINTAARHVADQRTIVDLRNEYNVYADRLFGPQHMPGLDPDKLFTMLLYKSVHLADFEAIRLGTSDLDTLYVTWRTLVEENVGRAADQNRRAVDAVTAVGAEAGRAEVLGLRLAQVARALLGLASTNPVFVQIGGRQVPEGGLVKADFWAEVVETRLDMVVMGAYPMANRTIPFEGLESLLLQSLSKADWQSTNRMEQNRKRVAAEASLHFLRHHSWAEIYTRPEFTVAAGPDRTESFAQVADRALKGSRLALDLIANGYLDQYFALYISLYYGGALTANALDYIFRVLDRGAPDHTYLLTSDEVESILREQGSGVLHDRVAYNVDIVDHLLGMDDARVEFVIGQIRSWGVEDQRFVNRFLATGKNKVKLIRRLAPLIASILDYTVEKAPVPAEFRPVLVDAALDYASELTTYIDNSGSTDYILQHYQEFPSLVGVPTHKGVFLRKSQTARRMAEGGVLLPDVSMLTRMQQGAVIDANGWAITKENLAFICGEHTIALDSIRRGNVSAYRHIRTHLDEFLDLAQDAGPGGPIVSVVRRGAFLPELREAVGEDQTPEVIERIITLADPSCRVANLTDAPGETWTALLRSHRTDASADNLLARIASVGEIDEATGVFLGKVDVITGISHVVQNDLARLAVAVLNASAIPRTKRVALVRSLELTSPVPAEALRAEPGDWVATLLREGVLSDTAETFSSDMIVDWTGREEAIAESGKFVGFVTAALLPSSQVAAFFASGRINDEVKHAVLVEISGFVDAADGAAYAAAARFAGQRGGVSPAGVVALIAESDLVLDEVRGLLRRLGGEYAVIADPGSRSPTVPNDRAHSVVLERLRRGGVVRSITEESDRLRIHLRRDKPGVSKLPS